MSKGYMGSELPEGYMISKNGSGSVLYSGGRVFHHESPDVDRGARKVARFQEYASKSQVIAIARLDEISRNADAPQERRKALKMLAEIFEEGYARD